MRLYFFALRWPERLMGKSSVRIMAQGLGTAYEDWHRTLPPYVDARLLRLRPAGRLHARRGSSGRLLQPSAVQPAGQSAHRLKIPTFGICRRSSPDLDGKAIEGSSR